jgi:hypothetical protein
LRLIEERVCLAHNHHAPAAFERPKCRALENVADDVDPDPGVVVGLDERHLDVNAAADAIARSALAAGIKRQLASAENG